MVCENTTRFLNVDLDLRAKRDLAELVAASAPEASGARFAHADGSANPLDGATSHRADRTRLTYFDFFD
jgi:hypothetical protein